MLKKAGSLNKKFNIVNNAPITFILVFILIFSFVFCCFIDNCTVSGSGPYTPFSPTGNSSTDINVENEYVVVTSEVDSSWMFDWGDGSFSEWISVGDSDTFISETHTWYSHGNYEVRVKHKSIYLVESAWSEPLIVTVAPPSDLDGDGWKNEIEVAYGTNPEDPNEFPLDTDDDDVPDEDSIDGSYEGDIDDDNDGLSDEIEITLGSNPRNFDDVELLVIESTVYSLVDTNENGKADLLYNTLTELRTKAKIENGAALLDINGNGEWDYTYDQGFLVVYKAPFEIPWLYVILGIIVITLLILYILFKKGILYLYDEEYVAEE